MTNENSTDSYNKRTGVPGFVIILLIAGAFIVGMFWNRMQGLEKQIADLKSGNSVTVAGAQAQPSGVVNNPVVNQPTPAPRVIDPITEADHIRGNRNADLVLIEWSDYQCPYCIRFHPTMEQVLKEYGDQVAWVYRNFPLTQLHPMAQKAAEAAECVSELGGDEAFWNYTDQLFTEGAPPLTDDSLAQAAVKAGVNQSSFSTCFSSGKYTKKVNDQLASGQKAGVTGTPGTVVLKVSTGQSQLIPGALPYEQIKHLIDSLL